MRFLIFLIFTALLVGPVYSQSRMTDREFDGLFGPVKSVKLEWKEITTYPGQKVRGGLIFISEDHYAQNGQVTERLAPYDYKAVYSTIDGFKAGKMITQKPSSGNKWTIVGKDYDQPIELPERITEPDPRFDFKLTYEYDDFGRVITEREFANNGKLQRLYTFKYVANRKVTEETTKYRSSISKTTYSYDEKGFPVATIVESRFYGSESENTYKDAYSEYEVDTHGNWISRKVEALYFEGASEQKASSPKYDTTHIEYRTITYY